MVKNIVGPSEKPQTLVVYQMPRFTLNSMVPHRKPKSHSELLKPDDDEEEGSEFKRGRREMYS